MPQPIKRKERIGIVVSDKMQKTITVSTVRLEKHGKYSKRVRKITIFKAHDEKNTAKIGDKVRIYETRPISKDKRWRLIEVVESAK